MTQTSDQTKHETLDLSVDADGVATLTLHRPDDLNAFDLTMARELASAGRLRPSTASSRTARRSIRRMMTSIMECAGTREAEPVLPVAGLADEARR